MHTPAHKSGSAGQVVEPVRTLSDVIDGVRREERNEEIMAVSRLVSRIQDRVFNMDLAAHNIDRLRADRATVITDLSALALRIGALKS